MRKKIYRTICSIVTAVVILSVLMMFGVYCNRIYKIARSDLKLQTETIAMYMGTDSDKEVAELAFLGSSDDLRITLITPEGEVLFDNMASPEEMENHLERPEIISAIETGSGESRRRSETIESEIYYYALRLENGNILRAARRMDSTVILALQAVPFMLAAIVLVIIAAMFIAERLTVNIMRPINEIDLDNPDYSVMYEELRPLFDRITEKNREMELAERIRREFSANVSHELRTPLTAISGYAQMIENGMVRPDDIQEFGHRIASESDRLILLINDIIRLSRLDESDGIDTAQRVNLSEIVRGTISRLEPLATKRGIHIFYSGEDAYINGNPTMIQELAGNIIDNAIKYNKDKGEVRVFSGMNGSGVELSVKDTGIGIPEEDLDRIFERFYRVDKSHSKTVGGTGLGLSIVKHAAICHGATISVKSTLGIGTQITVVFKPYHEPSIESEEKKENEEAE